jgi:hypothetical protein
MMDYLESALEGSLRVFVSPSQDRRSDRYEYGSFRDKTDLEELQAILLTILLFIWHGTPLQRAMALRTFPLFAALARKSGLMSNASLYSPLHQPGFSAQNFDVSTFDWATWVEQEKTASGLLSSEIRMELSDVNSRNFNLYWELCSMILIKWARRTRTGSSSSCTPYWP